MVTKAKNEGNLVDELFAVGAHFGFVKSRRHPSTKPFIFGTKGKTEIFDLEKTSIELEKALEFVKAKGVETAPILIVGGKSEAREAVRKAGQALGQPFVAGRWIGGTLTNWNEVKKRIAKLEDLTTQREKGELGKYTKKERLLIDREIDKLTLYFSGLSTMKGLPKVMVIVDPKKESNALLEAQKMKVPVVAIAGSDINLFGLDFAIPANDASRETIGFILDKIVQSYLQGVTEKKEEVK